MRIPGEENGGGERLAAGRGRGRATRRRVRGDRRRTRASSIVSNIVACSPAGDGAGWARFAAPAPIPYPPASISRYLLMKPGPGGPTGPDHLAGRFEGPWTDRRPDPTAAAHPRLERDGDHEYDGTRTPSRRPEDHAYVRDPDSTRSPRDRALPLQPGRLQAPAPGQRSDRDPGVGRGARRRGRDAGTRARRLADAPRPQARAPAAHRPARPRAVPLPHHDL